METAEGWRTGRAKGLRERLSLLEPLLTGERLGLVLTVLFFFLAFLIYYLTRTDLVIFSERAAFSSSDFPFVPRDTYFKGFVHAYNAFLHGRLDIANS